MSLLYDSTRVVRGLELCRRQTKGQGKGSNKKKNSDACVRAWQSRDISSFTITSRRLRLVTHPRHVAAGGAAIAVAAAAAAMAATAAAARAAGAAARADLNVAPSAKGIVLAPIVVGVKELFEPLNELKIVLEPALDQPVHRDYLEFGPPSSFTLNRYLWVVASVN